MSDPRGAQKRAHQQMKKATHQGNIWMLRAGQFWAFPSLAAFSVGAFIKLGGEGLVPPGISVLARIGATIVLLLAGVLAMENALYNIGDMIARRAVSLRLLWDIALLLVVGPLETWTLFLLIANLPANGPTDLMRAAEAVMATAYLGTLVVRPPSARDFVRVIGARASERAMEKLEAIPLDAVGMGRLYNLQAIAADDSLSYSARAQQLVPAMEELSPADAQRAGAQRIAELEAQVAEMETGEKDRLGKMLVQVLLLAFSGQPLPAWMAEAYPEVASLDFATLAGGKRTARREIVEAAPRTDADRQRLWLLQILRPKGITELPKAPTTEKGTQRQGCWLGVREMAALADGALSQDAARDLLKLIPETEMSGGRKVGKFRLVMEALLTSNLLPSEVRDSYMFLRESPKAAGATLALSEATDAG